MRGKTQAEAERRRDEAIENNDTIARRAGSGFTAATTVLELGTWWLANVAPHRMRPSSVGTVGKRLTRVRLGALADVAVADLSSEQVQEWQSGLLRGKRALSPSTVADTRVTLNQVLHVGHRSTTTTAGYVRSHKERDTATAKRTASILDVRSPTRPTQPDAGRRLNFFAS